MIGKCAFDKKPRAPKYAPSSELFVAISKLVNLRYKQENEQYTKLSSEEIKQIIAEAKQKNKITYKTLIKILNKEKIKIMHIHDNLGKTDTHQTPFTGTVNWKKIYNLIKEINNHCLFVFEVQKQVNEEEKTFLKNVYLAYEKMKKDLEKN